MTENADTWTETGKVERVWYENTQLDSGPFGVQTHISVAIGETRRTLSIWALDPRIAPGDSITITSRREKVANAKTIIVSFTWTDFDKNTYEFQMKK